MRNDLFGLKVWLQRFLDMRYRIDIVKLKLKFLHVTRLWYNSRWTRGPSLNYEKICFLFRILLDQKSESSGLVHVVEQ
jgi:hypothetical protein